MRLASFRVQGLVEAHAPGREVGNLGRRLLTTSCAPTPRHAFETRQRLAQRQRHQEPVYSQWLGATEFRV